MPHSILRFALLLLLIAPVTACETRPLSAAPVVIQASASQPAPIALPNREGSLKFAVLGDFGTGERAQYQLAEQMAKVRQRFPFELVILVGDNL